MGRRARDQKRVKGLGTGKWEEGYEEPAAGGSGGWGRAFRGRRSCFEGSSQPPRGGRTLRVRNESGVLLWERHGLGAGKSLESRGFGGWG